MIMRVSTFSTFSRVLLGLRANQLAELRAQEQLASGRRILRPSDDPAGTARALLLRRELASGERMQSAIGAGRSQLDQATSTLQHASELLTRARELLLQGMNGTLSDQDREAIATELVELRKQLLDAGNARAGESFVFGGTRVGAAPWEEVGFGDLTRVLYLGDGSEQVIQAGEDARVAITIPGDDVFGRAVPGPARFDGLTGVRSGTTADEGRGYAYLVLRHDATDPGTLATVGLQLVNGGADDTLLGANRLVIDAAAGTLQLEGGAAVTIPADPLERADVVLQNERGGELHLDLTGWTGADFDGTVTGQGSISFDGDTFSALSFSEGDLELSNHALGLVLHVNTTEVLRAGRELVTFGETVNAFDLVQGIVEDLHNDQGLDQPRLAARLSQRLEDLGRVHDDLLLGLGVLGSRSARLANALARAGEIELERSGDLSRVEDADLAAVALDLARSDQILQLAQAAGARLIQTTLLDFLG